MAQFLSLLLVLSFGLATQASNVIPVEKFQELTAQVVATGKATQGISGIYLTVADVHEIPQTDAHQADYISTIGGFDGQSNYHFARVELVAETWSLTKDNRWDIDQWLFAANVSGEVSYARHVHMVQTLNGTVLIHETVLSTPAEDSAQWDTQVNKWHARLVAPKPLN